MNRISAVLRFAWGMLCGLLSLGYSYLLFHFCRNPLDYPIGSDAPWWHYRSFEAYILFLVLHILWYYCLGVLVGFCASGSRIKLAMLHILVTILWFVYSLCVYSYAEW